MGTSSLQRRLQLVQLKPTELKTLQCNAWFLQVMDNWVMYKTQVDAPTGNYTEVGKGFTGKYSPAHRAARRRIPNDGPCLGGWDFLLWLEFHSLGPKNPDPMERSLMLTCACTTRASIAWHQPTHVKLPIQQQHVASHVCVHNGSSLKRSMLTTLQGTTQTCRDIELTFDVSEECDTQQPIASSCCDEAVQGTRATYQKSNDHTKGS